MSCWFPRVVAFRVPKPLDQVLQLFSPPLTSVAADGLDLVLFSSSHEVRWWPGIVFSVFFCFAIWGKEGGVEDGVNSPFVTAVLVALAPVLASTPICDHVPRTATPYSLGAVGERL